MGNRLLLLCITAALFCTTCVSKEVREARTRLRQECNDQTCTVGMGTCQRDPEADLMVCLCDHGCLVME